MLQSLDINAPKTNVSCLLGLGNKPFVVGALYLNNMETEIWKDIPGHEGYYQASNQGRIKSLNRTIVYKNGQIREKRGMILSVCLSEYGYPVVVFCENMKRKNYFTHRLVALAFIPNPLNLPQVNHKDENPLNNYVDNLEWCTPVYNIRYGTGIERRIKARKTNGKIPLRGEQIGTSKLKENQVIEIYKSPLRGCELAKVYNITKYTISLIKHKKAWKQLLNNL